MLRCIPLRMANDAFILQGGNGGTVIADTTVWNGNASMIQVINDAVIDQVGSPLINANALEGLTLSAGLLIGGRFSSLQLTSGVVIVYNT